MWEYNTTRRNPPNYLAHARSHQYVYREQQANGTYKYYYPEDLQKIKKSKKSDKNAVTEKSLQKDKDVKVVDRKTGEVQDSKKVASTDSKDNKASKPTASKSSEKKISVGKKELKKYHKIITDVMVGKYGNGADRKKNLAKLGLNYDVVQGLVNNKMIGKKMVVTQKQLDELDKAIKEYSSPSVKSVRSGKIETVKTAKTSKVTIKKKLSSDVSTAAKQSTKKPVANVVTEVSDAAKRASKTKFKGSLDSTTKPIRQNYSVKTASDKAAQKGINELLKKNSRTTKRR